MPQDAEPKTVVLEHHQTHRLFMLIDGPFADQIAAQGFIKHEITTAAEYDRFAKKILAQEKSISEEDDYLNSCRKDEARKRLRNELISHLDGAQPKERAVIEATLRALDVLQKRHERTRESYFMRQAYEESRKDASEELTKKIITNA